MLYHVSWTLIMKVRLITSMNTSWTDSEALGIQEKITLHSISNLSIGHRVNIYACPDFPGSRTSDFFTPYNI